MRHVILSMSRTKWLFPVIGAASLFAASMAVGGMVLLPIAEPDFELSGIWDAICSAAGVVRITAKSPIVEPGFNISKVAYASVGQSTAASIGRGATLAHKCAICHGAAVSNDIPKLAGQTSLVIFKELQDFKSGARLNASMGPFAAALSEQDVGDVAAYYGSLTRTLGNGPPDQSTPLRIVNDGAPMRNIAPCGACHGSMASKVGAPWLEGQSAVYLKAQLDAFKASERHNDIGEQMRNVARQMTSEEIIAASNYFAAAMK